MGTPRKQTVSRGLSVSFLFFFWSCCSHNMALLGSGKMLNGRVSTASGPVALCLTLLRPQLRGGQASGDPGKSRSPLFSVNWKAFLFFSFFFVNTSVWCFGRNKSLFEISATYVSLVGISLIIYGLSILIWKYPLIWFFFFSVCPVCLEIYLPYIIPRVSIFYALYIHL